MEMNVKKFSCFLVFLCTFTAFVKGSNNEDESTTSKHLLSRLRRQSERDPYIFNLFEVLLTTLETKLRRVENLDRAIEHLSRRMERMEGQLSLNLNATTRMAHLFEVKFGGYVPNNGTHNDTSESEPTKLEQVAEKMEVIDSKLTNLQLQLDTNSLTAIPQESPQEELVAAASENVGFGFGTSARIQALDRQRDNGLRGLKTSINSVQESVSDIDRKLQFRMARLDDSITQINQYVGDIREAVIDDQKTSETQPLNSFSVKNSTKHGLKTKLDTIEDKISPMQSAWTKMNEVWDVVVGTKNSVDVLVPKSERLINNSVRQERAITTIQEDLTEKANRIIHNLAMVERHLKYSPSEKNPRPGKKISPIDLYRRIEKNDLPDADNPPDDQIDEKILSNKSGNVTVVKVPEGRNLPPLFPKKSSFTASSPSFTNPSQGYSCSDILRKGEKKSGLYHMKIRGTTYWLLQSYCDMETDGGGWTVIQRRVDTGEPRESFNRSWQDYKHGFGKPDQEFWLGNENIYMLTNNEKYVLRIELEDFDGQKKYAEYKNFMLHGEKENYQLEIGGFSGDAGDSLDDPWYGSNLSPFSTFDRDNDRSSLNCAAMLKGGWWWRSCGRGLNGLYLPDSSDLTARQGIVWFRWRGWDYTLKSSVMMIRPYDHPTDDGVQ